MPIRAIADFGRAISAARSPIISGHEGLMIQRASRFGFDFAVSADVDWPRARV